MNDFPQEQVARGLHESDILPFMEGPARQDASDPMGTVASFLGKGFEFDLPDMIVGGMESGTGFEALQASIAGPAPSIAPAAPSANIGFAAPAPNRMI